MTSISRGFFLTVLCMASLPEAHAADVPVSDAAAFREAMSRAEPGTRILLAPGKYPGGFHFNSVRGTAEQPIVIAAADPANPPVFENASGGLQLSDPQHLRLENLVIRQMTGNGLNIDDGGSFDTPAKGVVLHGLKVSDIGPGGNRDAIKLSGVVEFRIENCLIERWGTGGGSGVDMVGCHRGVIVSNAFRHTDTTGSTGVQCKGGTADIVIRQNRFEDAGGRAVNIGGSTGLQFFRPPLKAGEPHAEAKNIQVEGNTFVGGGTAVAFVGVDGAAVRFNTIYHPKRWGLRILQETRNPGFVPSRHGAFTDNLVVFDSRDWAEGGVNIGDGTAPETFTFARNWWYCLDQPSRSRPRLPTEETEGVYGKPPKFRAAEALDLRQTPDSPAKAVGAEGIRTARAASEPQR